LCEISILYKPNSPFIHISFLFQAYNDLEDSRVISRKNNTLLRVTKMHLKDDIVDKERAMNIDAAAIRLRKRRSNHRWVMEGKELKVVE